MIPCSEIRPRLDAWLDGELAGPESNQIAEHVSECPECAAIVSQRKAFRVRLQAAVASTDGAGPRLRSAAAAVTSQTSSDRNRWYYLAAAAIVLLSVAVYGTWRGPGEVMEVGLGQHIHCAINRTYPASSPSPAEMEHDLGPEYAGLLPVVAQNIPSGYRVVMAHRCSFKDRKFVHVIARDGANLVSLLITRRDAGESFASDLHAVATEAQADLYSARSEKLSAAGFETPRYFVYLVSDMDEGRNLRVFQAMTPSVKTVLARS